MSNKTRPSNKIPRNKLRLRTVKPPAGDIESPGKVIKTENGVKMMELLFKNSGKKILCLHSDDWVRVVALVSMIQSVVFILGGGLLITSVFLGYNLLLTVKSILYVLTGMTVGVFGLFLGMYLYDGVDEKNPKKLLVWMFYAGFVQLLLMLDLGKYLLYYPVRENWENILGIVVCLIIYSLFMLLNNVHRQELQLLIMGAADSLNYTTINSNKDKQEKPRPSSRSSGRGDDIEMQRFSVTVSVPVPVLVSRSRVGFTIPPNSQVSELNC